MCAVAIDLIGQLVVLGLGFMAQKGTHFLPSTLILDSIFHVTEAQYADFNFEVNNMFSTPGMVFTL